MSENRIAVIGASRGLGAKLSQKLLCERSNQLLGVARKEDRLESLKENSGSRFSPLVLDLAEESGFEKLVGELELFKPDQIFYVAGGGPHGPFQDRPFHSHQWAWKVTFEGAARICHWALKQSPRPQVILIGSAICEGRPDPLAASYAAAKHALFGLYSTLRKECPEWDLRLFSPGYLDTELLPKNSPVRYNKLWDPGVVASKLIEWSQDKSQLGSHRSFSDHPDTTN